MQSKATKTAENKKTRLKRKIKKSAGKEGARLTNREGIVACQPYMLGWQTSCATMPSVLKRDTASVVT
jgi:hypothetical protein